MKNNKIIKWLTALLVAALMFIGIAPTLAHATGQGPNPPATHKTDVVITKMETNAGLGSMTLDELANGIDDLEAHFGAGAVPLSGVSFTYYSVSASQLATLKADPADYDTPAKMSAAGYGSGSTVGPTNSNGQVTIPNLANGNYWIVENDLGTIQSSVAVPFGLTLPFTNLSGSGWLNKIYVYPKNVLEHVPAVTDLVKKIKVGNELVDHKDFNYGDVVKWHITVNIPKGIEDYDSFIVRDPNVAGLEFVANSASASVGSPTITHNSTNGLVVNFNDSLAALAGANSVTITFDVIFTASISPDVLKTNTAYLDYDNGHGDTGTISDTATVITGGEKFKKIGEKDKGLDKALFIIRNAAGDYYNLTDGKVTFGTEVNATEIESNTDGTFEVKGLAEGTYVLKEIKAPEGYALPTNQDVATFTVVAKQGSGSYTKDLIKISNTQITIPQTGGMGTAVFTVIGGLLMIFAVVYYRKTSEA